MRWKQKRRRVSVDSSFVVRVLAEALETRRYLSITPTIYGFSTIQQGASYPLELNYSGSVPTSWAIDWGDGDNTTINGDPSSTSHTYSAIGSHTIQAEAFDGSVGYDSTNSVSVNVGLFQVFGTSTIEQGSVYTLTLPAVLPDNQAVTGWNINWGDNSDPDGDGLSGQTLAGSPISVSHTFTAPVNPQSGTVFEIQATASTSGGEEMTATLPVFVTPGLVITGPQTANVGDALNYSVTGPGAAAAVWDVLTPSNTQYTTGFGSQLSFAPAPYGNWTIEVTSVVGGNTYTSSLVLPVTHVAPVVTISGPIIAFVGRNAVFTSSVSEPAGENDSFTYSWSITDGGSNIGEISGALATLPSYQWLAQSGNGSDGNNLAAELTVDDSYGDIVTKTYNFEVLPDPGESDYEHTAIPVLTNTAEHSTTDQAYSVIQQPDGKIVVAGSGNYMPGDPNDGNSIAFIARFNADLTPDLTFGNAGIILNALGGYPNEYDGSAIFAMAIDPVTDDIVVAGNVARNGQDGLVIGRYEPTGLVDPTFGKSGFWMQLPPGWGTWNPVGGWSGGTNNPAWTATPYTVVVLPDSSILIGGSRTRYWYSSTQFQSTDQEDDFLLMKLTSSGSLDPSFGIQGYADTVVSD
jgi:uncharacterized delta-60 repeat protein